MLRPPLRAGATSIRSIRPSRNRPSRAGASRKSSADRDGRGVDDDQVPLVAGPQLAQLLHRHVLLRTGEGRAHGLVEGVDVDLLGPLRVGVRGHDLVEGPLHVEHHGVQLAGPTPGVRGALDRVDLAGRVVQLGQPERLGQPAGRVDGEHHRAPAVLLGRPQRQRRRRGRLADAARAAADDDPDVRVGQQRVDVQTGSAAAAGRHAGPPPEQHARPARTGRRRRPRRAASAAPAAGARARAARRAAPPRPPAGPGAPAPR